MTSLTHLQELSERAHRLRRAGEPPLTVGIVHPCQEEALLGAYAAAQTGLIAATVYAPRQKLQAVANRCGVSLDGLEIVDVPHSHAAADTAVAAARTGRVKALMKGSLHTDELLAAVLDRTTGLRTDRRISHVFVMEVPRYPKLLMITDGAVNIAPTLDEKADIVRNAVDLAHALAVQTPRVALLSAVETVTSKLVATVDAAALCKMAERGQIAGAILDGPLAFDNAISAEAAHIKGLRSPVSGQADVLVVPDLESGNILAKQLEYLAGGRSAGIVLGARVPIMLTSRSDPPAARAASCAVAYLWAQARKHEDKEAAWLTS